ncbi:unnamed protein product [Brugia timori]|uniref:Innexin n=1 Tax=Brugia timori TaxID=42155 RepID=A0A0R3QZJ6_9BILA|nr:unnamed protein product [Brugia timori]
MPCKTGLVESPEIMLFITFISLSNHQLNRVTEAKQTETVNFMTRSIAHTRNTHFVRFVGFDLIHFGMVTSRWIRMIRVARSYPRWLWNNWPTHFVGVVFCFVPMTVIVIYDIFKYGSGYNSMPYYRKYYHVVRPDDPIVLEWRPPEVGFGILTNWFQTRFWIDVYKGSHFLHISNAEYSFLDVTEILAWVNILFLLLVVYNLYHNKSHSGLFCQELKFEQLALKFCMFLLDDIQQSMENSILIFFEYIQNDVRNGTRWIYVEFFECPSVLKINVNTIRAALARWINEECATAIQCNLVSAVEVKNVLVGTIFCGTPNNFITFLVLRNATTYAFLQANHLDLNIVGKVIQSREHLLSALLHSDLKLVTTRVFNEETSGASSLCGHLCCAIVILSFIVFVITFFTIYFKQRNIMERKSVSSSHSLLALQLLRN